MPPMRRRVVKPAAGALKLGGADRWRSPWRWRRRRPRARPQPPRRDPPSCHTVRFSDVGWTDVTSTTALTAQLLRDIGYTPTVTVLSVPVTFASLKNNDIDVFLGNWMPAQEADRAPLRRRRLGGRSSGRISSAPNTPWRCRPTPTRRDSRTSTTSTASDRS